MIVSTLIDYSINIPDINPPISALAGILYLLDASFMNGGSSLQHDIVYLHKRSERSHSSATVHRKSITTDSMDYSNLKGKHMIDKAVAIGRGFVVISVFFFCLTKENLLYEMCLFLR